jgi:hypothetical protein
MPVAQSPSTTDRVRLRGRPWVRVQQTIVFLRQPERADFTQRLFHSCAGLAWPDAASHHNALACPPPSSTYDMHWRRI